VTDVDGITALLPASRPGHAPYDADAEADMLRPLVYLPNATIVVALAGRKVVGAAMLALRPSVNHGGLVGTIDLLATDPELDDEAVTGALLPEILRSARNKGCVRVEVEPAAGRAARWTALGFREEPTRLALDIANVAVQR
jgi:hypothetical protein